MKDTFFLSTVAVSQSWLQWVLYYRYKSIPMSCTQSRDDSWFVILVCGLNLILTCEKWGKLPWCTCFETEIWQKICFSPDFKTISALCNIILCKTDVHSQSPTELLLKGAWAVCRTPALHLLQMLLQRLPYSSSLVMLWLTSSVSYNSLINIWMLCALNIFAFLFYPDVYAIFVTIKASRPLQYLPSKLP